MIRALAIATTAYPKRIAHTGTALLLAVLVALASGAAPLTTGFAQTPPAASLQQQRLPIEDELERLKLQLDQIARGLTRENLSDADLAANRQGIDPILQRVGALIAEQQPKVEALAAQLEKLGPKPDAKAPPESAEAAKQRADLDKARELADGVLRVALSLAVRAGQLNTSIVDRRRALLTRALFERSSSILSPLLWTSVARALPGEVRALSVTAEDWAQEVARQFRGGAWPAILLAALIVFGMLGPLRRFASRYDPRDRAGIAAPGPARKSTAAALIVGLGGGLLFLAAYIVYALLEASGVLPQRVAPVAAALVYGIATVAALNAFADAHFAPLSPAWRISGVGDQQAQRISRAVFVGALVVVAGKVIETLNHAIAAALPVSVATRAVFAALFAVLLLKALRNLDRQDSCDEESLGPAVPTVTDLVGPVRTVLMIAGTAILAALVAGYVALASFLVDQVVWLMVIGIVLTLALRFADDIFATVIAGDGPIGRTLMMSVGFRRRPLERVAVVLSGVARLALIFAAALFALAPWGIESGDVLGSVKAAMFGFKIGDVTISLSAIVVALAVFVIGIVGTRGLQRWLDDKFLPRTDLDAGLRNSIRTALGYLGFAVAAAVAVSSVGFSLDRIAIVAGALSVGIGFGLQSVVSNFVSGLILLWERSIKVGDWIVVGEEQGYVRRINVRATEIETFDRTSVIVPNSNLVSGVVKNKVHHDRSGRVMAAISVPRDADPALTARLLEDAAAAQPDILDQPPPRAFFKRIGETTLDFELYAFVADVETGGRVSSELHFAVHQALARHGLDRPIVRQVVERGAAAPEPEPEPKKPGAKPKAMAAE